MQFNNKKPIYIQIKDTILKSIINKEYSLGDKIESVREIANKFTVNQNTVLNSYKELENENIIILKRGIGYFVTEDDSLIKKIKKDLLNESIQDFLSNMKELGYSLDETIECIKEVYNND
ncbi:MAG: GntR family transcriptional regulator [Streptobacillus sp.]